MEPGRRNVSLVRILDLVAIGFLVSVLLFYCTLLPTLIECSKAEHGTLNFNGYEWQQIIVTALMDLAFLFICVAGFKKWSDKNLKE